MKKLILALSAALLVLGACGEKNKTFTYGDLTFTYPSSYELDSSTHDDGSVSVYLQHKDILSNSLNMDIINNEGEALDNATEEEILDYLVDLLSDYYDDYIDDDFEILTQSDLDTNDSPLMAYVTLSGNAYGESFDGEFIAMQWDEYTLLGFVSGKDETESDKVLDIFLSFML